MTEYKEQQDLLKSLNDKIDSILEKPLTLIQTGLREMNSKIEESISELGALKVYLKDQSTFGVLIL
jgi:hypothetical protein